MAAGGCISRRLVRPKTAGSWSCRPIDSASRPHPEKLVKIAIRRIAHAVIPTPKTSPSWTQVGPCAPMRLARPSMGAFTQCRPSPVCPPTTDRSGMVGNADAAAVATAA